MKEALQTMTEQTENKWLKGTAEVLTNVEKGNTLADSMAALPDIFPPMLVNMVQPVNHQEAWIRLLKEWQPISKKKPS